LRLQLGDPGAQLVGRFLLDFGLESIYRFDFRAKTFYLAIIPRAEDWSCNSWQR